MKIALSWLRQWVPTQESAEEIAHRLTMGGLEVEDLILAPSFSGVVVAHVLDVQRHPNADRLSVCQVDTGDGQPRTVVCGAPNVAAGLWVPCALPGAVLPGDFAIRVSKVRGITSEGMLCSARELGLSEDASGLMLLEAGAAGTDLRAALDLDDPVFEIKLTPNRGDCLSALGVARELAALSGLALTQTDTPTVPVNSDRTLPVTIADSDLCGRFCGRVLANVDARAPTPAWLRRRLEQAGQRSISALVDISNFVMLELGQPSHVFDLDKVHGGLVARWAGADESITLLNEATVKLDGGIGVVADDRGPEAIAGIMGGLASSVSLDTTSVFLEAAFWWPEAIQGRTRRLNFSSEAAHRFERGTDPGLPLRGLERVTQLIVEICGTAQTHVGPLIDIGPGVPPRPEVELRMARLCRVLGIEVDEARARQILLSLGMNVESPGAGLLRVRAPSHRFDIEREEDLIEEVARIVGYDSIPALPPVAAAKMRLPAESRRGPHDLRLQMAQLGYQELVNFSFVPESWEQDFAAVADPVRVLNPIAAQHSVMRTRLAASLVANLKYNLNRQATRVRSFELARVFHRAAGQAAGAFEVEGICQPLHLAGLAFGADAPEQWALPDRAADFFDVKGDVERLVGASGALRAIPPQEGDPVLRFLHPGRAAVLNLDGQPLGWIGELHPRLSAAFDLPAAPVLFEVEVDLLTIRRMPDVAEIARFPALIRDIALWFNESVPAGGLLDELRTWIATESGMTGVRDIRLFDVFRPASGAAQAASTSSASGLLMKEKSLAFRIVLQDTLRSLTEQDADAARSAIVAHLVARWGARERQS